MIPAPMIAIVVAVLFALAGWVLIRNDEAFESVRFPLDRVLLTALGLIVIWSAVFVLLLAFVQLGW